MKHYDFPTIRHLQDVLPFIEDAEEIKLMDREGHQVIDYLWATPETFPAIPDDHGDEYLRAIMRRECRGLLFDPEGGILGRRLHKFFNLGEKAETQPNQIDLSIPHTVLTKEDGSMLSPFMDPAERVHWVFDQGAEYTQRVFWGTMMGWTDVARGAENYIRRSNFDYDGMARVLLSQGWNPIFEWCSPDARIVLGHERERLVFLACRNIFSGEYMSLRQMHELADPLGIPVVKDYGPVGMTAQEFLDRVREEKDIEGYIIRFHNGHSLKLKTAWYLRFHKSKENLVHEKDVWNLILNDEADDIMPVLMDHDRINLDRFIMQFQVALSNAATEVRSRTVEIKAISGDNRAKFAELVKDHPDLYGPMKGMAFKLFQDPDPEAAMALIRQYALNSVGSGSKIEEARKVIQVEPW